ncbi:Hypothetical protein FKW44_009829 [Caligus rogercresseyi]|uniref:Uncharacterized protein n=1 Tax=Caligus rogercresseyi TaxID=217165 RepID=A0A7T8K6Y0_CALRO|nr:Hypothetical protein FKW44_009829 [Caligus rogercresseyi]
MLAHFQHRDYNSILPLQMPVTRSKMRLIRCTREISSESQAVSTPTTSLGSSLARTRFARAVPAQQKLKWTLCCLPWIFSPSSG